MDDGLTADAELEARAKERLGEVLRDKYRLDRVLGFGGMATVYAATHRNGKEVALKLLHPELAHHTEVRSRFLREGYVANQVKHPGAVSVLDDDLTDGGGAFLVMELLSGLTVQELWEQKNLRVHPAWVTAITLQVLDVIASAHDNGIIHRDIKPANLFVTRGGEVKVLDFGIARMRAATTGHTTNHGTVLGTPAFMAPEQAMGKTKEVDETTDLWAVASVAFALLVGEIVHPGDTTQQTLIHAATRPARALAPLAPDAPAGVVAVLEKALAFERSARWPSAVAMREALEVAGSEAYGEVPGVSTLRDALGGFKKRTPSLASQDETRELARDVASPASAVASPLVVSIPRSARDTGAELLGDRGQEPARDPGNGPRSGPRRDPGREPPREARQPHSPLALVTGVGFTTNAVASPQSARAVHGPMGRLVALTTHTSGRTRGAVFAAVIGVAALMFPWIHHPSAPIAEASADAAGPAPSPFSVAAPTTVPFVPATALVGDSALDDSRDPGEGSRRAPLAGTARSASPASSASSAAKTKPVAVLASSGPASVASVAPSFAPNATAGMAKGKCTPPFVIDRSTGRKVWKIECL